MIFDKQRVWYFNIPIEPTYGYSGGGVSRDYAIGSIPCAVTSCPCNKREKCEMPSNIKIGPDGACKFGKVAIEMDARDRQAQPLR